MFCNKATQRPQRNVLLENLFLWKPYAMRYGGQSVEQLETVFSRPKLSDCIRRIENRRTHIETLQKTLRTSLSLISNVDFNDEDAQDYLCEADVLTKKLTCFINDLRKCERAIQSQLITFRNLVLEYRALLRDILSNKTFKQDAASFLLLCIKLSTVDNEKIEEIKTTSNQILLNQSADLFDKYRITILKNFDNPKESSEFVDEILRDIIFRRETLEDKLKEIDEQSLLTSNHPYESYFREQYQNANRMIAISTEYQSKFQIYRELYNDIDRILFEYKDELSRKTLEETNNSSLPTNEQMSTFECSRLILISELLRSEIERIDTEHLFPRITKLVYQWKENSSIDPKIYDLFSALETDLLSLYDRDYPLADQVPFRVGFIGNISVGKSSLVNYLRTKNTFSLYASRTLAPTAVGQSTVGSLQFDENHYLPTSQKKITVRYVDIEGCTDYNAQVHAASYFEQIRKADCDLYLILLTGQQASFECKLKKEISENLNRMCWFVRSKVDQEFNELFQEHLTQQKIDNPDLLMNDNEENELAEQIIEQIREKMINMCKVDQDELFLVNSRYQPTDGQKKFTSQTHPFDIDRLSQRLLETAHKSLKQERIQRMAMMACAHAIGTCLRRRCIISFLTHQLRAGVTAVFIPWGDQLALSNTCYQIRLALGIQDNSAIYNSIMKTTDRFRTLLLKYPLNISKTQLYSDEFVYLQKQERTTHESVEENVDNCLKTMQLTREQEKTPSMAEKLQANIPSGVVTYGIVGKGIAATTAAMSAIGYGIGVGFLGLTLVTAIPISLWTMRKSNKQIRDYLNDLCADLLIISEHFIIAIINEQMIRRET